MSTAKKRGSTRLQLTLSTGFKRKSQLRAVTLCSQAKHDGFGSGEALRHWWAGIGFVNGIKAGAIGDTPRKFARARIAPRGNPATLLEEQVMKNEICRSCLGDSPCIDRPECTPLVVKDALQDRVLRDLPRAQAVVLYEGLADWLQARSDLPDAAVWKEGDARCLGSLVPGCLRGFPALVLQLPESAQPHMTELAVAEMSIDIDNSANLRCNEIYMSLDAGPLSVSMPSYVVDDPQLIENEDIFAFLLLLISTDRVVLALRYDSRRDIEEAMQALASCFGIGSPYARLYRDEELEAAKEAQPMVVDVAPDTRFIHLNIALEAVRRERQEDCQAAIGR